MSSEPIGAPPRVDPTAAVAIPKAQPAPAHLAVRWEDEELGTRLVLEAESCGGLAGPWSGNVTASGKFTGSSKLSWASKGMSPTDVTLGLHVESEELSGTVEGPLALTPVSVGDAHQLKVAGTLKLVTAAGSMELPKIEQYLVARAVEGGCR